MNRIAVDNDVPVEIGRAKAASRSKYKITALESRKSYFPEDDEAITILRHCRGQIHDNGKLILLEAVIEPGDAPHPSKFMDIEMIVSVVGKERTENEIKALFKESGFKLSRIIPTPTPVAIIEAIPV